MDLAIQKVRDLAILTQKEEVLVIQKMVIFSIVFIVISFKKDYLRDITRKLQLVQLITHYHQRKL